MGLADQLSQQASGQGPSVAGAQFKAAADTNLAQQQALAAGARGPGIGAAARGAAQNASNANQSLARDAATARMQEQISAREQLAGVLGQGRGQDIGLATDQANLSQQRNLANAGFQQQTNLANQDASLRMSALNDQTQLAAMAQQMGISVAELQARMQQDALEVAQRNPGQEGMLGDVVSLGGTLAAASIMSDQRNKTSVQKLASGGQVQGPGGPKDDRVPILASNGEYVIKADAAKKLGSQFLDYLNQHGSIPRYQDGGMVNVDPWSQEREDELVGKIRERGNELKKEQDQTRPALARTDMLIKTLDKKQDKGFERDDINREFDRKVKDEDKKASMMSSLFSRLADRSKDQPENGRRKSRLGGGLSSVASSIMPAIVERNRKSEVAALDKTRREGLGKLDNPLTLSPAESMPRAVVKPKQKGTLEIIDGSQYTEIPGMPEEIPVFPSAPSMQGMAPRDPREGLLSDERLKEKLQKQTELLDDFLNKLQAYSFDYKNPERDGNGTQVGVMAQDLQKSELGKTLVHDTEVGKVIDTRKAIGPILAALAHLTKSKKDK
jgi:hypothetical protein